MNTTSENISSWCLDQYNSFEKSLNGSKGGPLHQVKKQAFDSFKEVGFPTPKVEAWKYTNLSQVLKAEFKPATEARLPSTTILEPYLTAGLNSYSIAFVNGFYSEEISAAFSEVEKPAGVEVKRLAEVLSTESAEQKALLEEISKTASSVDTPFASFNTALFSDGAYIKVSENTEVEVPIRVVFLTTPDQEKVAIYPRLYIDAAKNSKVKVVESYVGLGAGGCLTNAVGQIVCADNARVEHYKLQRESESGYHVGGMTIEQGNDSFVTSTIFSFGGSLVRNEVYPSLFGTHAETTVNGLTVVGNEQHVDNYTIIDHAEPDCQSNELFKGIYGGSSRGVFSGTIIVRPDAQKTNAIQSNKSLLLTDNASIETRPQLKIWADDVKCTHGATVGQLDEEALFYLRARGLSKSQARKVLIHAFSEDLLSDISLDALKEHVLGVMQSKLELLLS